MLRESLDAGGELLGRAEGEHGVFAGRRPPTFFRYVLIDSHNKGYYLKSRTTQGLEPLASLLTSTT